MEIATYPPRRDFSSNRVDHEFGRILPGRHNTVRDVAAAVWRISIDGTDLLNDCARRLFLPKVRFILGTVGEHWFMVLVRLGTYPTIGVRL